MCGKKTFDLRPSEIRFTQDSINNSFTRKGTHFKKLIGETLDELCECVCEVADIATIKVFYHKGFWRSADNRRLWVFKQFERLGGCEKIGVKEITPESFNHLKFTTKNDGREVKVRGKYPGGLWYRKPDKYLTLYANPLEVRQERPNYRTTRHVLRDTDNQIFTHAHTNVSVPLYGSNACRIQSSTFYRSETIRSGGVFNDEKMAVKEITPDSFNLLKFTTKNDGREVKVRGEYPGGLWYKKPDKYLTLYANPLEVRQQRENYRTTRHVSRDTDNQIFTHAHTNVSAPLYGSNACRIQSSTFYRSETIRSGGVFNDEKMGVKEITPDSFNHLKFTTKNDGREVKVRGEYPGGLWYKKPDKYLTLHANPLDVRQERQNYRTSRHVSRDTDNQIFTHAHTNVSAPLYRSNACRIQHSTFYRPETIRSGGVFDDEVCPRSFENWGSIPRHRTWKTPTAKQPQSVTKYRETIQFFLGMLMLVIGIIIANYQNKNN